MLPILPTMGVGSYASPGWLISARKMLRRGGAPAKTTAALTETAITYNGKTFVVRSNTVGVAGKIAQCVGDGGRIVLGRLAPPAA